MAKTVWTQLIDAIHASDYRLVAAITGGGSKALGQLLERPGASQTVLEAIVPYAPASLQQWLGGAPDQACSASTARAMAMTAWRKARQLAPEVNPLHLVGLGTTASLASHRAKRGAHRIHVAVQTATQTTCDSLVLSKGQRDRKKEEWLAAKLGLVATGRACQIDSVPAFESLSAQLVDGETIDSTRVDAEPSWAELLVGTRNFVTHPSDTLNKGPIALFPGAFNPPHDGHRRMAQIASKRTGRPVVFELSITNVDKRPLDFVEIATRKKALLALDAQAKLLLTSAPTFRAKSALFPGCTFVVGADTMRRVADPKYYAGKEVDFRGAIAQIAEHGCRFLVFGRKLDDKFYTLSNLTIPNDLLSLCDEVSADDFREDISSTSLRLQR